MKLGLLRDTCESPVSVIVTLYVAFSALVGAYCTVMVQLEPGLTTAPFTQVPPVIEKVPVPVPLTLVNVGAAVSELRHHVDIDSFKALAAKTLAAVA